VTQGIPEERVKAFTTTCGKNEKGSGTGHCEKTLGRENVVPW